MGKTGIRTVGKVDLNKPAAEQPNLHVCHLHPQCSIPPVLTRCSPGSICRTDGTQIVRTGDVELGHIVLTLPRRRTDICIVPFAGAIKDGETVKIECLDWYQFSPFLVISKENIF